MTLRVFEKLCTNRSLRRFYGPYSVLDSKKLQKFLENVKF